MSERLKEIRSGFKFEIHALKPDGIIDGYVAMFNKPVPSYKEKIMVGAFNKTLGISKGRLPVFYLHDPKEWHGMGLSAVPDDKGVFTSTKYNVDHSERAREVYAMAEMSLALKNPAGYSIGFNIIDYFIKGEWKHLTEIALLEWSLTPPGFQAAPFAQVTDTRNRIDILLRQIHQLSEADYEALLATVNRNDIEGTASIVETEPDFIHSINSALKDCLKKIGGNPNG